MLQPMIFRGLLLPRFKNIDLSTESARDPEVSDNAKSVFQHFKPVAIDDTMHLIQKAEQ